MAFVDTFFTAVGRLSVRFRWAIVLAWVAGAVAAMTLLPSLSSVTQSDNTSFLPGNAPSEQAAQLASPLQGAALTAVTVVAARADGTLTGADQAFVARLAGSLSRVARVVSVRDAGQSADGRAEQLTVLATLAQSGGLATAQQATLVAGLRDVIRLAGPPSGFSVHTAGPVATRVDTNATSSKTGGQVQWFSIIFVIALLVAVFRSALAPLIAVLPAVVVVLVAERLTAEAAVHGLGVSQIASLLLMSPLREAVGRALSVTGTTVTSAGLVLAGTFGVLAIVGSGSAGAQNVRTIVNVGVGLALGVLMDTFLVRTLLVPAAVVLIGRWNWWPSALSRARPADDPSGDPNASFTTYKLLLKLAAGESPDLTRGSHDR